MMTTVSIVITVMALILISLVSSTKKILKSFAITGLWVLSSETCLGFWAGIGGCAAFCEVIFIKFLQLDSRLGILLGLCKYLFRSNTEVLLKCS